MLDKSLPSMPVLMIKKDVDVYPRFEFPEGYSAVGYRPGGEEEWAMAPPSLGGLFAGSAGQGAGKSSVDQTVGCVSRAWPARADLPDI